MKIAIYNQLINSITVKANLDDFKVEDILYVREFNDFIETSLLSSLLYFFD